MRFYQREGLLRYATLDELRRAFSMQLKSMAKLHKETSAVISLTAPAPAPKKPLKGNPTNVDKLEILINQIRILQNMLTQLRTTFAGEPRVDAITKAIEKYRNVVQGNAAALQKVIAEKSKTQISRRLKLLNTALAQYIDTSFKKQYQAVKESFMVATINADKSSIANVQEVKAEISYLKIIDLVGTDGYTYPEFYIVLAIPEGKDNVLIATLTEYRIPKKIRWEATAKNPDEVKKLVPTLLVQDGLLGKAYPRDVPIPKDYIKFGHPQIKDVKVDKGVITITVKTKKIIEQTRQELRRDLTSIVRNYDPKNRDIIKDQVDKSKGTIKFVFALPSRLKGRLIPKDDLAKIQKLLSLDPQEVQRIRTALEDPA